MEQGALALCYISGSLVSSNLFERAVEALRKVPIIEGQVLKERRDSLRFISLKLARSGKVIEALELAALLDVGKDGKVEEADLRRKIWEIQTEQTGH